MTVFDHAPEDLTLQRGESFGRKQMPQIAAVFFLIALIIFRISAMELFPVFSRAHADVFAETFGELCGGIETAALRDILDRQQ